MRRLVSEILFMCHRSSGAVCPLPRLGMRILITGGKGQLGRELLRALEGNEVFSVDPPEMDIQDPDIIQTILDIRPQVIIHAAALTDVDVCELDPERAYRVNAAGTKHVAEAAGRLAAKLVYI